MIEQAKFNYSHSGEALEKQTKITEDQGETQIRQLKNMENNYLILICLLEKIIPFIPLDKQL